MKTTSIPIPGYLPADFGVCGGVIVEEESGKGTLFIHPINPYTIARITLEAMGHNVLHRRVIAYVGSFGGFYLTDEMMDFYETAQMYDPSTFALVLTQTKLPIKEMLAERGYSDDDMLVTQIPPDDLPRYLQAADMAISFIKPGYSKLSSSPTKIGEYLACGVPVISNRGIGDLDELITENRVGVLLDDFSPASYVKALQGIDALYRS